jgi:hypothetical protein
MEFGVLFNVDGRHYPLTVEEAWLLREHLPTSDEPLGGPSAAVAVRLEQVVLEADGIAQLSPEMPVFNTEKCAICRGLDNWLHAVKADAFPDHAWALRDALFVEDLGELAFRDVVFRFRDGQEAHVQDVLVTGAPFEHGGRWWSPQSWRSLHHIDPLVNGRNVPWLICAETPR